MAHKPKKAKISKPAVGDTMTVGTDQLIEFEGKNHSSGATRKITAMVQVFYRMNGFPFMKHPLSLKGEDCQLVGGGGGDGFKHPASNPNYKPVYAGRHTLRVLCWNGRATEKPTSAKDIARTLQSVHAKSP